jgi:hypothetical protein
MPQNYSIKFVSSCVELSAFVDLKISYVKILKLLYGKHKVEIWYYEKTQGQGFTFLYDGNADVIQTNQFTVE